MSENNPLPTTRIEVLTGEHHLVGDVSTGGRRFSTWLNLDEARTLRMENVALRSLPEAQRSYAELGYVLVNREAIVAVIPREHSEEETSEAKPRPMEYVDKERHEVVLSAPPFALRGHIHVARSFDLYLALNLLPGTFVPVTEARLIYTPYPEYSWQGQVVLVNRARAHLYWPADSEPREESAV